MSARTSPELEQRIVQTRRRERRGPDWIAAELGVPARTVSRVSARHGLPQLAHLDPFTDELIRASRVTTIRYERDHPGDLVHMDVKEFGRIPDGGGWKALGRDQTDRNRHQGPGYDYVHSLIDDHSRFAYTEVLSDETVRLMLTRFCSLIGHGSAALLWLYRGQLFQS